MKAPHFASFFLAGVFLASITTLRADSTNAFAQGRSPFRHLKAPTGLVAEDPAPGFNPGMFGTAGVLTGQQRASLETALRAEQPRLAQLQAELRTARRNLFIASLTNQFDENALRQKAMASVARVDAEMIVVRLRAFSKIQPPLTAEQIEKIKTHMPGMARELGHRPLERAPRPAFNTDTNQDINGLPPKH